MVGSKPNDNVLQHKPTRGADSGDPNLQILQQLKIIAILLRQAFGITDDDATLLRQPDPPTS